MLDYGERKIQRERHVWKFAIVTYAETTFSTRDSLLLLFERIVCCRNHFIYRSCYNTQHSHFTLSVRCTKSQPIRDPEKADDRSNIDSISRRAASVPPQEKAKRYVHLDLHVPQRFSFPQDFPTNSHHLFRVWTIFMVKLNTAYKYFTPQSPNLTLRT